MDTILDLETYPLDRLDTPRGRALVARCRSDLAAEGMFNLHNLVRPEALARCMAEIAPELRANAYEHRQLHNIYFKDDVPGLAPDHPALKKSETANRKICADQIAGSTLDFVARYDARLARALEAGREIEIDWLDYDWSLNEAQ